MAKHTLTEADLTDLMHKLAKFETDAGLTDAQRAYLIAVFTMAEHQIKIGKANPLPIVTDHTSHSVVVSIGSSTNPPADTIADQFKRAYEDDKKPSRAIALTVAPPHSVVP